MSQLVVKSHQHMQLRLNMVFGVHVQCITEQGNSLHLEYTIQFEVVYFWLGSLLVLLYKKPVIALFVSHFCVKGLWLVPTNTDYHNITIFRNNDAKCCCLQVNGVPGCTSSCFNHSGQACWASSMAPVDTWNSITGTCKNQQGGHVGFVI